MEKISKIIFCFLFLICIPLSVNAATLSLSPASGSHVIGDSFTIGVYAGSPDQAMNAASGVISFPQDKLNITSISKTGSVFSFWTQEPIFSNTAGTISFEGIVPNPGFIGSSGKILTITFKVKAGGSASINFSSSSVLANDGKGTNILTAAGTAKFTLGVSVPVNIKADQEKPSYFDVVEVPRKDETDPRIKFIFNASDDIGIDHYEIMIDGVGLGVWKNDESGRYEAPPQGPGKHTIIVKAIDKAENARSSTLDFFIKGLDMPVFTEYSKNLQSGEILSVLGTTYKNGQVRIWIEKKKEEPKSFVVKADANGQFMFISDDGLPDGVYDLWAEASDARGARSLPTEKVSIVVSKSALFRIGGIALNFLSILIPLVAMLFVLIVILFYGWHRVSVTRKRLRMGIQVAESALHKSFNLIREDIKENIEMLEKTNSKRELTKEEDKILKQLKRNLTEAEKFITQEIDDVDKLI